MPESDPAPKQPWEQTLIQIELHLLPSAPPLSLRVR